MFKKVIFSVLIIYLLIISFVYGQGDVCDVSPEYISCLRNLINDITSNVKVQIEINGKKEEVNLKQDIKKFKKFLKNGGQSFKGCFRFYSNSILQNANQITLGLFAVLKSPEAVVRDYESLWQLGNVLEKRFFDLCRNGWINYNIPKDVIDSLNIKFSRYNQCNGLVKLTKVNLNSSARRSDIFSFLYRLVNIHKELLTQISRGTISDNKFNFILSKLYYCQPRGGDNKSPGWCKYFDYKINLDLLKDLKNQYIKCPFEKVNFFEEINKLVNIFSGSISKDLDRIITSYDRLKNSLQNINGGLTDYEAKIASEYWNKPFSRKEGSINPFGMKRIVLSMNEDLSKERDEFKTPFIKFGELLESIGSAIVDTFGYKKEENKGIQSVEQVKWKELYIETVVNTLNVMNKNIKRLNFKEIELDPTSITRMMPNITYEIQQARYLIGRRDNQGSITWFLGKACENQCSNVGGICWYY